MPRIVKYYTRNRDKRIVVLYDQNTALANQIIVDIQSKVNFTIEKSQNITKHTTPVK